MFTALASLFANRPRRPDVAMIAEITLRGLVLPICGLKEKSLAAMRAGISTVTIPKPNEKILSMFQRKRNKNSSSSRSKTLDEVLSVAPEKNGAAPSGSKVA
jgi:ATP-dependent Lon protease